MRTWALYNDAGDDVGNDAVDDAGDEFVNLIISYEKLSELFDAYVELS